MSQIHEDRQALTRLVDRIDSLDFGCPTCGSQNQMATGFRPPKDSSMCVLIATCTNCGVQDEMLINSRKLAKLTRFLSQT